MKRNKFWLISGAICLFTFFVHLIGGQLSLVDPLLASELDLQVRTEWLGAWHGVSVVLVLSAIALIRAGLNPKSDDRKLMVFIGWVYLSFGFVFIGASAYMHCFAPQWILLLPIGGLGLLGGRNS